MGLLQKGLIYKPDAVKRFASYFRYVVRFKHNLSKTNCLDLQIQ